MRFLRRLRLRLRTLFQRRAIEDDLETELHDYFEREIESLITAGVSPAEARERVASQMQAKDQIKEKCRDTRGTFSIETLIRDLRYGLRVLRKNPGFSGAAALTLALGIATCTTLFSVAAQLWRPIPLPHSERLVTLWERNLKQEWQQNPVSVPDFADWRERTRAFSRIGAMQWPGRRNFAANHRTQRPFVAPVSSGFFETLGIQPEAGRTFEPRNEQADAQTVAMLSDALARKSFGSAKAALGEAIQLDAERYSVIGVLPPNFRLDVLSTPDVFLPLAISPSQPRDARGLLVIARLRDDATLDRSLADVKTVAAQIAAEHPDTNANFSAMVQSLNQFIDPASRAWLLLLLAFSIFVMVIACANVAVLQLMRSVVRQREFAVREALGASRSDVLRQIAVENAWLGAAGAIAGIILAFVGVHILNLVPRPNTIWVRETGISFNLESALFAAALSIGATFFFTLVPALFSSGTALEPALRSAGRATAGAGPCRRIEFLAGIEVSLAFLSLFGAGLFASSAWRTGRIPLGFNPQNVLTMGIPLSGKKYSKPKQIRAFNGKVAEQLSSIPGIGEFALSSSLPLQGAMGAGFARADAPRPPNGQEPFSFVRAATPGYFHLLGIPILKGRAFSDSDGESSPRVAIVNENLARDFFNAEDPVGKHLSILRGEDPAVAEGTLEIVGIAANVKEVGLNEVPFNDIYVPASQTPAAQLYILAKTGAASSAGPLLRRKIQSLDPAQFVAEPKLLDSYVAEELNSPHFRFSFIAGFAGLALLLTGVALFGTLSFAVARQRREIGVRIAVGARPGDILRMMFRQTLRLTIAGAVCGFALALALGAIYGSRLYMVPHQHDGVLYGVSIHDPLSLAGAAAAVVLVAFLAGLLPAFRAAGIDPNTALRCE